MARRSRVRVIATAAGAVALVAGLFGTGPARADTADAARQMTVKFAELDRLGGRRAVAGRWWGVAVSRRSRGGN